MDSAAPSRQRLSERQPPLEGRARGTEPLPLPEDLLGATRNEFDELIFSAEGLTLLRSIDNQLTELNVTLGKFAKLADTIQIPAWLRRK